MTGNMLVGYEGDDVCGCTAPLFDLNPTAVEKLTLVTLGLSHRNIEELGQLGLRNECLAGITQVLLFREGMISRILALGSRRNRIIRKQIYGNLGVIGTLG
jgi:hypothetical protein